jgi:hypothetical protein
LQLSPGRAPLRDQPDLCETENGMGMGNIAAERVDINATHWKMTQAERALDPKSSVG